MRQQRVSGILRARAQAPLIIGSPGPSTNRIRDQRQEGAISPPTLLTARGLILERPRLGPFDLALATGEVMLLAGASGSGKSRLLRTLADLDRPEGGTLELAGHPARAYSAPDYRSRVAYLPASPQLGSASVAGLLDRVARFGARRELSDPRAGLRRLGLSDAILERAADELSTGETVRVALALLLSGDARVLLLDEPTGALDPPSARAVEGWVRQRADEGAAVLWVSHDPEQAARMGDGLLTLANGSLSGPLRDPARFANHIRRVEPEADAPDEGVHHDR